MDEFGANGHALFDLHVFASLRESPTIKYFPLAVIPKQQRPKAVEALRTLQR
jgi:hypothetical protein